MVMQRSIVVSLFLFITSSSLSTPAFASTPASIVFPPGSSSVFDTMIPVDGSRIALGDPHSSVQDLLGRPATYISPNEWMYENVHVTFSGGTEPLRRNLHIVFVDGKIADLSVVSDRKRNEMIAEAKRHKAVRKIATTTVE